MPFMVPGRLGRVCVFSEVIQALSEWWNSLHVRPRWRTPLPRVNSRRGLVQEGTARVIQAPASEAQERQPSGKREVDVPVILKRQRAQRSEEARLRV